MNKTNWNDKEGEELVWSMERAEFRNTIFWAILILVVVALIDPPEKYWTPIFIIFATAKICSCILAFKVSFGLVINKVEKKYLLKEE
jgi:hypothetical protein